MYYMGHILPAPGGSPVLAPKSNAALSDKGSAPLKVNVLQFRKNVSDLRVQLHQMRQLQARPLSPFNYFKRWYVCPEIHLCACV